MKIKKENVQSIHKLTSMQQGMMLNYLSDPLDKTYFEQLCLKINGLYNEEMIKKTWIHIVNQYEMLRTVFRWKDLEEPIQVILHANEPDVRFYHGGNDKDTQSFLTKFIEEDLQEGMDLEKSPFRVTVVRDTKNIYYMLISHHHILYDGWSNSLIINRFYEIYSSLMHDREIANSKQTDTSVYYDYLKNHSTEKANAHWKDYLKNYCAVSWVTNMPEDAEINVSIEKILLKKEKYEVKQFCQSNGITPASLLFAVLGLCLQKILNCSDIVIGVTVSGRNLPIKSIDQMVGLFIQTIPLRFQTFTEQSFLEFFQQVNTDIIGAYGNEIYSIADIKRHLEVPVDKELFEVFAIAENYPMDTGKLSDQQDLQIQYHMSHDEKSAVPLSVEFRLFNDIEVYFKYQKGIVHNEIIESILHSYPEILQQILGHPHESVNKLIAIEEIVTKSNLTIKPIYQQGAVRKKYDDIANSLKTIWADILEIPLETISDNSNFFDLGGHSLRLTYLILRLQKKFNISPTKASYIYKIPTITLMAEFIGSQKQKHISIPKQPLQAHYKVSPAQKSYYMFQMLYPLSVHYNMISAYVIDGFLEMDRLKNSLEQLVDKHESLRTTFFTKDGDVFQQIHDKIDTPLFYLLSEGKKEEQIIKDFIAPFDLSTVPLLKVGFAQLGTDRFLMVFQLHHVISDGISNQILIQDLIDAYRGNLSKKQTVEYSDFSEWLLSQDRTKQKQYWECRLKDNVFRTEIVPAYTNADTGQQGWQSGKIHFELGRNKYKELNDLAAHENVSLHSLLLSFWAILLHKLSNQTHIITGTVVSGRTHPDIEKTVGLFVNTLPFSVEIHNDQSYRAFLSDVNQLFITDMDHQEYEQGELVNDLLLSRSLNGNPLFNTMFVMQNMKQTEFKLPDLSINEFIEFQGYTKYDLTLFATPLQDALRFDMEFREALFNESLVRKFSQYYIAIMDKATSGVELPLREFSILPPEQKQYILHQWNPPVSKPGNKTVQALFSKQVKLNPDKIAIIDGDKKLTYTELNMLANKITHSLRACNVKQGDIVAVYMDNSAALVAGLLGILKTGATYLPIDIETPRKRLSYILEDSGCQHVLVHGDRAIPLESGAVHVFDVEELADANEMLPDMVLGAANDTMYIIYTSGTTGQPKGCLVEQKSVVNYLEWAVSQYYNANEDATFAFFSSPAFDLSVTSLFSPLICGQTVVIYSKKLDSLYQMLSDNLCNIIKVTPTQLRLLISKNCNASKIKTIVLGGEQFTVELAEKATEAFGADIKLYNEYGPTEATVGCMIHQYNPTIDTGHAVSIGVPSANMQIFVLNPDMEICPVGVKGEIYISGIGVSPGYLNQPELSQSVFIEYAFEGEIPQRLYKTGDIGVLAENGLLYYVGRLDGQIKIHGYRIETEDVQQAILQVSKMTDVCVLPEQGKSGDQFLSAFYISEGTIDIQNIKSLLAERLPHYMMPAHFYRVDEMPTTLSGKIDVKRLLSLKTAKRPKKNRNQKTSGTIDFLRQLWINHLDIEEVELDDNFFDIGGNSYVLLKMHEELLEKYPQVEITDFFKYPTIRDFAQFVDRQNHTTSVESEIQTIAKHPDLIAVIGIGLRLHHANSLWELKDVFANKTDCVRVLPTDRKNDLLQYLAYLGIQEDTYEISEAAFLDRIDTFDYKFFRMTKSEAELTDPYHRILLETAHQAFEDSGYRKEDVQGSNTGVYIGQPYPTSYYDKVRRIKPEMAIAAGPGNVDSIMAGRIAYYYDLKGPSMMINTACSSSLSALYLACQAIRSGEIEMGLIGGINLVADPSLSYNDPVPDIVSSTARARTFSEDSDGTGRGEGCIVVLIKQYDKAVQDCDNIYAVIKGAELNNDGKSIGITAPNINMQETAVQNALRKADISPEEIGYIETHGTGTKLGDPIELAALTNVFRRFTNKKQFCALGAAKTNYGHLDSSAGLLGFVKAIACLRYKIILPNIHMTYPNNKIDFIRSPFYLPDEVQVWDIEQGRSRYACVSAFGLSGTNCHMVLEEYITEDKTINYPALYLFVLSAKSESSLQNIIKNHLKYIQTYPESNLQNICYTLQTAREHYEYRIAIMCHDMSDLIAKLIRLKEHFVSDSSIGIYYNHKRSKEGPVQKKSYEMSGINLETNTIEYIAQVYINFAEIDWGAFYKNADVKKEHLPTYVFDPLRCWIDPPVHESQKDIQVTSLFPQMTGDKKMEQTNQKFKNQTLKSLMQFVAELFGEDVETIDKNANFFELGIDSISIIQLKHYLKTTYGMDVSTDVLFHEWSTLESLAQHVTQTCSQSDGELYSAQTDKGKIDQNTYSKPLHDKTDVKLLTDASLEDSVETLFAKQLEIIADQLEVLKQRGQTNHAAQMGQSKHLPIDILREQKVDTSLQNTGQVLESQHNHAMKQGVLNDQQHAFLQILAERYTTRTAKSKCLAQQQKKQWANGRFAMGYSKPWKEMLYPIYATQGDGAKIWDEDGNEYIDFAMGFGVHLYGHRSPIITEAIKQQMDQGVFLGPLNVQTGEVADLICELTGVERVAFCNSGTEAVMNLMRIARATSNKNKIAIFSGAFHGTFDGVYMMPDLHQQSEKPVPFSLGTPQAMANDVIILPYGEERSFEILSAYKDELAAVLVEPVQSRTPELQPVEFLHKLRDFTATNNIALIFDEIITGFRLHPGGAQAYFSVKADMVAYGKVTGGGMPIGVFAGDKKYMDKVDGGYWPFGDDSGPYTYVAQTGGTFRGHALTMAGAKAVLTHLRNNGPELQNQLNEKTKQMAEYLNKFFADSQIPVRIAYFGSLFVFKSEDMTLLRFLFYMLIEKGIYLWEGGTCFVSFSHSDADLCRFAIAVQEVFAELVQQAGYLFDISSNTLLENDIPSTSFSIQTKRNMERCLALIENEEDRKRIRQMFSEKGNIKYIFPVTAMQNRIISQNIIYKATHQDIAILKYTIQGALKIDCLQQAWNHILNIHPIFKTGFIWRKFNTPIQVIYEEMRIPFSYIDISGQNNQDTHIQDIYNKENQDSFDNSTPPLIKIIVIKLSENQWKLIVKYQNSLFDGWSAGVVFGDLFCSYCALIAGENHLVMNHECALLPYVEWLKNQNYEQAKDFWEATLGGMDCLDISKTPYEMTPHFNEGLYEIFLCPEEITSIQLYAKTHRLTLNTLFQGAWGIHHSLTMKTSDLLIATITSGRPETMEDAERIVGVFSNVVPVRVQYYNQNISLNEWMADLQKTFLAIKRFDYLPSDEIAKIADIPNDVVQDAIYFKTLVYLNNPNENHFEDNGLIMQLEEEHTYVNVPLRMYVEPFNSFRMVIRYDENLFSESYIAEKMKHFKSILLKIVNNKL